MRNRVGDQQAIDMHAVAFELVVAKGEQIIASGDEATVIAARLSGLHREFCDCVRAAEASVACVADAAPALLRKAVRELVDGVVALEQETDDAGRAALSAVRERFEQQVLQCRRRKLERLKKQRAERDQENS